MTPNRFFFPQEALDEWVHDNKVELSEGELVIRDEGRKYRIVEAVRILREVTGGEDVYDLVGKVKTVNFLVELDAELLESSMIIEDLAYDVIPGFVASPVGSLRRHLSDVPRSAAGAPETDEELLAQYLERTLG